MARSTRKPDKPVAPPVHVTVRGIAEAAGVSIGSVSSVLNNRHVERRISPETVEKVKAAAARMGYLPNIGARRLRSGVGAKPTVILALITSYEAPLSLVNHFVSGLREVAQEPGGPLGGVATMLLIEMFAAGHLQDLPGLLSGDHFNAAIITNTTTDDDAFLAAHPLPYPTVLVNRRIPGYSSVVEDAGSGVRAAEILVGMKRRKLAVLHGSPLTQITKTRIDSFMRTAQALTGVPAREIIASQLSEEAAAEAMNRFFEAGGTVDGLYTVTDGKALGAYHAIRQAGLSIPDDIAVIGVGDYDISRFFSPPLSCVGVPHSELGRSAARLLLQRLRRSDLAVERVELSFAQHLRASTGHSVAAPQVRSRNRAR
ncbi:MAG: LacI family DNA-binding transcriptional regulator [Opitutaceae bacterium]|nr:LacI family DNA-binding transcriptional regulator [Opitutaceae bacterium]